MAAADRAREVRPGEEIDLPRLQAWLADRLQGFEGPIEVHQFPAGFSNLSYLLSCGQATCVLRRPPGGTRPKSGHDMKREYTVLAALVGHFDLAPRPLLLCEDESVIGAPFYLAERLEGLILRRDYPADLLATPALARAQQEALVDTLAALHAVDYVAAGLADLGQPEGYVARQVHGWVGRYERARTEDAADAAALGKWLVENIPTTPAKTALLHNDFKLDNVVFDRDDPRRLIGVLDWEMATLGDQRMDLGCSLAYWIQADDPPALAATRTLPTHVTGSLTRAQVIERYERAANRKLESMSFFYTFGLFRLAVIAQQIYLRFVRGQTRDPRFAVLGEMTRALLAAAEQAAAGRLLAG